MRTRFLLCIAGILIAWPECAAAIDCQTKAGGSGWSWRSVQEKKCWYLGPRGMDKAKLRWPAQVSAKKRTHVPLDADGNVIHTSAEQRLLVSHWPPLPGAKP